MSRRALAFILLTLSIADVVSFATDSPWDDTAAAVELVVATLVSVIGITTLVYGTVIDRGVPGIAGLGGAVLGLGVLSMAHAGWSFAENDRAPTLSMRVEPLDGGAMLGVSGTF